MPKITVKVKFDYHNTFKKTMIKASIPTKNNPIDIYMLLKSSKNAANLKHLEDNLNAKTNDTAINVWNVTTS